MVNAEYMDKMVKGYLECALKWSTGTYEGEPVSMDEAYGVADFTADSVKTAHEDCLEFVQKSGINTDSMWTPERAGHFFWLTRCGHGAGFWHRSLAGEDAVRGNKYAEIARSFGDSHLSPAMNGRVQIDW